MVPPLFSEEIRALVYHSTCLTKGARNAHEPRETSGLRHQSPLFPPRLCSHLPWSHKPSAATICLVFSQYMLLSIQFKLPECLPGAGTCAGGLTPPRGSGWALAAAAPTWDLVLLRRNLLAPRLASWLHPHNHLFLLLTGINNYPTNRPLLVSTSHWRLELILHFTMFLFGF